MRKAQTRYAETIILRWYVENPSSFDTSSNNEWLLMYMNRWLGVQKYQEWFIRDRMLKMPYETFRRVTQQLISEGKIEISARNMKTRHRLSSETRETMLQAQVVEQKKRSWVFIPETQRYREVWI
jgi:hypothetical protein